MTLPAITKRLNEMRLRKLLRRGYLPAELPPPFTSQSFSAASVRFAAKWNPNDIRKFWTVPEGYSIPRYGEARRKLSIVNPVNQLHVAQLIADNWDDIRTRLSRSSTSEFKPQFSTSSGGRAITGVDFDGVARRRAKLLATFGRYVKTDVTRFYPSIYTHSIAWAVLGKSHAKATHKSAAFKAHYSNFLDRAVAAGQEGQTIGIPIGPDTSRIIAELVAVEVEEIAKNSIDKFAERSVRYVDDIYIGLNENETADGVLSGLSLAMYEYQLELNAEKTGVWGLGRPHTPEWIHFVRTFNLTKKTNQQRDDIDSFFEHAIFLGDQNSRENALLFAVKRAASFDLHVDNLDHYVRWLLYCSRRSATCLGFVAEHLAVMHGTVPLPDSEIHDFILQQIPIKAAAGHSHELAWLLFWAREIGFVLPASALSNVVKIRSSVVALVTLDLVQRGLIDGVLDLSFWQSFADADGLKSEMWLLSYEASKKAWWPAALSTSYITSHPFFADVWSEHVEFYDTGRRARRRVLPSLMAASADQGLNSSEYPF